MGLDGLLRHRAGALSRHPQRHRRRAQWDPSTDPASGGAFRPPPPRAARAEQGRYCRRAWDLRVDARCAALRRGQPASPGRRAWTCCWARCRRCSRRRRATRVARHRRATARSGIRAGRAVRTGPRGGARSATTRTCPSDAGRGGCDCWCRRASSRAASRSFAHCVMARIPWCRASADLPIPWSMPAKWRSRRGRAPACSSLPGPATRYWPASNARSRCGAIAPCGGGCRRGR